MWQWLPSILIYWWLPISQRFNGAKWKMHLAVIALTNDVTADYRTLHCQSRVQSPQTRICVTSQWSGVPWSLLGHICFSHSAPLTSCIYLWPISSSHLGWRLRLRLPIVTFNYETSANWTWKPKWNARVQRVTARTGPIQIDRADKAIKVHEWIAELVDVGKTVEIASPPDSLYSDSVLGPKFRPFKTGVCDYISGFCLPFSNKIKNS